MKPSASFLDTLELAASRSAQAENDIRREWAERIKTLERERAFAHRRFNFMRAIAEAVATAESEEIAVAAATAAMRAKLGWWDESEARTEALSRFVPVAQQVFAGLEPAVEREEKAPSADVLGALAAFETWYRETHPHPFWMLFENQMPETPLVDF
jgi:hypothetical protein